jgi:hypothetical protein
MYWLLLFGILVDANRGQVIYCSKPYELTLVTTLLACTHEEPGSNPNQDTDYSD